MDQPSRQDAPAQTPPATQGVRRRFTIMGPVTVLAVVLPLAGHEFGWKPTAVAAVAVAATIWLVAQVAAQAQEKSDRDRIRGESALRIRLADISLQLDAIKAQLEERSREADYTAGYLTGARRRLVGPSPTSPAGRTHSWGPEGS